MRDRQTNITPPFVVPSDSRASYPRQKSRTGRGKRDRQGKQNKPFALEDLVAVEILPCIGVRPFQNDVAYASIECHAGYCLLDHLRDSPDF